MRRTALTACLIAVLLPATAQAQAPVPPELAATLTSCVTGVSAATRSATFTGSMPALDGSSVLAMRFDLERRTQRAWKAVSAATFGRWERSIPGAAGFVYDKRVERLPAPAEYRATIRFRWWDAAGHPQRDVRRRTAICRQPDLRPAAPGLVVVPEAPGPANPDALPALSFRKP
jgi:hypothetical protein